VLHSTLSNYKCCDETCRPSTAPDVNVPGYRLPLRTTSQLVADITPIATQPEYTLRPMQPPHRPVTAPTNCNDKNSVSNTAQITSTSSTIMSHQDKLRYAQQQERQQLEILLRKGSYIPKPFGITSIRPETVRETGTIYQDRRFFRTTMFGPRPQYF
jgi:hypothetical protein